MSLADCRILELPKVTDPLGNLTFLESGRQIPFDLRRVERSPAFYRQTAAEAVRTP